MGRILVIICIIVLIVGGVWWWRNYHNPNVYDGSVVRRDAAMETGTTTMENGQNLGEAHPTPSRSDYPGTVNGQPYRGDSEDVAVQTTPITQDPYGPYPGTGPYDSAGNLPPARPGNRQPLYPNPPARVEYPANRGYFPYSGNDSQPPENPDGLRFGGNGGYEWYRQGNLTYRVNSRTGTSCIAYATMEEWRKPWVFRHACRAS